jgi:hypothetical protein
MIIIFSHPSEFFWSMNLNSFIQCQNIFGSYLIGSYLIFIFSMLSIRFFAINVLIIEQLSPFTCNSLCLSDKNFLRRYFVSFIVSFNPRSIQIITGLGYHVTEGKENGNGLTMANLECESLD